MPLRFLWSLCVPALLGLFVLGPAAAAGAQERDEGLTLQVEVGLGGAVVSGRWAPITIWSSAHAPMSGEVAVRYGLDPTQAMRYSTGFAATPGELVPVQLAAPMPTWLEELSVSAVAVDASGKRWSERVTMSGFGPGDLRLPALLPEQSVVIGVVGVSSAVRAMETITGSEAATATTRRGPPPEIDEALVAGHSIAQLAETVGAQPRLIRGLRESMWVRLEAARLPEIPLGYDALSLLILRADAADEMSSAQVEAVRRWTRAGGRLVLLASGPGDHWRRWLDDDGGLPLGVAGGAETFTPPRIDTIARKAGAPVPGSLSGRTISLTEAGARARWQVSWAPPHRVTDRAGSTGLMARGPLGLGWVTVLGIEPGGALGDSASPLATGMWLEAMLEPLEPRLLAPDDDSSPVGYRVAYPFSGSTAQQALAGVLDTMTFAPPAGAGAFVAIAIAAGLLALLVGPIDYFLLGRLRARGRWWLTSLVWIGLASVIAWWGPAMLRTEPTSVQRHETIDIRLTGDAGAEPVWVAGVTALFSAQPGVAVFENQAEGAWWRGASPLAAQWGQQPSVLATPVRVRTAGPSGPAQGHLERTPIRMWTLRTFLDHSEGRRPLAVRLAPDFREAQVAGLAAHEQVEEFAVRRGDAVWTSRFTGNTLETETSGAAQTARLRMGDSRPVAAGPVSTWSVIEQAEWRTIPAFAIEGAAARAETIDRLLDTGRFAMIYLETTSTEPAISVQWDAEYHTRRVYRIIVPLRSEP